MTKRGAASRAVSVRKSVYEKLQAEAERRDIGISTLVEQALAPVLGTRPPPARRFVRRRRFS